MHIQQKIKANLNLEEIMRVEVLSLKTEKVLQTVNIEIS